jgi:hypothetical protein
MVETPAHADRAVNHPLPCERTQDIDRIQGLTRMACTDIVSVLSREMEAGQESLGRTGDDSCGA